VAGEHVSGQAPFFALAWFGRGADLRGYTPGTHIGQSLFAAQAEWRWQATRRLGIVFFGGVGKVGGSLGGFEQAGWLPAGGIGLRWRLTQQNRLNFRIDYGHGKDDDTLIVSVGEAF
jgi:hemolysin activation/secretion protein